MWGNALRFFNSPFSAPRNAFTKLFGFNVSPYTRHDIPDGSNLLNPIAITGKVIDVE
ncbi:MAG: hypothetical protein ACJA2Q_002541 [Pseudohongiellaceae bacterium]|jgi:hypothetical protein